MGEILTFGDTKDTLRKRIVLLRECMTISDREKAAIKIFDTFFKLPEYQNAEVIYAFAGYGTEISTLNSVFKMINSGKRVALPKILDEEHMEFFEVKKISDIQKNNMGIPEPEVDYPPISDKPDIILVPGTAFDYEFNRLGYGRGYYDRYLTEKGFESIVWKIALGFACQVVGKVPADSRDVPVDMIITEKRTIR